MSDEPVPDRPPADASPGQEAIRRDEAAYRRDRAADRRDHSAELRDDAAARRDDAAERTQPPVGSAVTAGTLSQAESGRSQAATDRRRARSDREAGALGRMDAERDRVSAQLDREASAAGEVDGDVDALTGCLRAGPGLAALDVDVLRARHRHDRYVVALIAVEDLRSPADGAGAAAGDQVLVVVAAALRAASTADHLLIRHGVDEFLYALPGLTLEEARARVTGAATVIAAAADGASVTTGYAELRPGDSPEDLVARARAATTVHPDRGGPS